MPVDPNTLKAHPNLFPLLVSSVIDYAIFALDTHGHILTWNEGAQRIKGYKPEEIIGKHFSIFYTPDAQATGYPQTELVLAANEGRWEDEGWRVRKDGTRFWANVVITALRDETGKLVAFAKVTRDLTERRLLDEERIARASAEEAARMKDDFLAIAAHELRTPLTALQLEHSVLQRKIPADDTMLRNRLDRAVRTGNRLGALVESLLDVGRMATGRLTLRPEPLDLGEAVHQVTETMRGTAAKASCELTFRATGALEGHWDRLRMEQVTMNVLSNAIKYGAGAPVTVSVERDGDDATIEVVDGGPGITTKDLDRIFGRFERAASVRNFGGLGLGLYVCRQIIEAHGGAISARNRDGGGTAFTIRVPIAAAPGDGRGKTDG
jgi:PAS domain S-box-containing protein